MQDNLNTHASASLYEAFPAREAQHLASRFEWHHTPKHGSWLNLAEVAIPALAHSCLDRRIPSREVSVREVKAYVAGKNLRPSPAQWHFTREDVRTKLASLYPRL